MSCDTLGAMVAAHAPESVPSEADAVFVSKEEAPVLACLVELGPIASQTLLGDVWAAAAAYGALDAMEQMIVSRMVRLPWWVAPSVISTFVDTSTMAQKKLEAAIRRLVGFGMLERYASETPIATYDIRTGTRGERTDGIRLTTRFREAMVSYLKSPSVSPWDEAASLGNVVDEKQRAWVDEVSVNRWNNVLAFLLGSEAGDEESSAQAIAKATGRRSKSVASRASASASAAASPPPPPTSKQRRRRRSGRDVDAEIEVLSLGTSTDEDAAAKDDSDDSSFDGEAETRRRTRGGGGEKEVGGEGEGDDDDDDDSLGSVVDEDEDEEWEGEEDIDEDDDDIAIVVKATDADDARRAREARAAAASAARGKRKKRGGSKKRRGPAKRVSGGLNEAVVLPMARPPRPPPPPPPRVVALLAATGLVEEVQKKKGGGVEVVEGPPPTAADFAKGKVLVRITAAGHRFLLEHAAVQLWTLIQSYIRALPTEQQVPTVQLLLRLSFSHIGDRIRPASLGLGVRGEDIVQDLAAMGVLIPGKGGVEGWEEEEWVTATPLAHLVTVATHTSSSSTTSSSSSSRGVASSTLVEGKGWVRKSALDAEMTMSKTIASMAAGGGDASLFIECPSDCPDHYTTRSSSHATVVSFTSSSLSSMAAASAAPLGIVVEKNFRVFAYTTHALHARLISLFANVDYALPNLVAARITRRSARRAFARSISAAGIVAFLRSHPHSSAALGVPENVEDILHMWEQENDRVRVLPDAMVLSEFDSAEEFREVEKLLRDHGLLRSSNAERQVLVSAPSADTRVAIKEWRKKQQKA